jgi:hypothetical protein
VTLCCRVETAPSGVTWVSALPVIHDEWAQFVRSEAFFDDVHWPHAQRPVAGGDAVLARTGYRWRDRHRAVTGVTWDEAQAFCRYSQGRLPWLVEWQAFAAAAAALARSHASTLRSWLPVEHHGAFGCTRGFEWCGDAHHRIAAGPHAYAEPPLRRRLTGGPGCLVPTSHDARLGFRVAFEDAPFPCATRVADWALIDLPLATKPETPRATARVAPIHRRWGS